jgi:hypothetical protein
MYLVCGVVGGVGFLPAPLTHQTLMMMTEMVFETLVQYGYLTRLIAREDDIKFSRRESSKTYMNIRMGLREVG